MHEITKKSLNNNIVHATTVALTIYALTKQLHVISLRFIGTSES